MQKYTGSRPSQLCPIGCLLARSRLILPLNTGLELQFTAPRSYSSSSSDSKHPVSKSRLRYKWQYSLPFPSSLFSPPNVSQESELMKSEMQIMTAQLGSTATADESPRSDKGEKKGSIFVFTRVPSRDKRIFTSFAKKSSGNMRFPRGYVTQSTCECTRTITTYLFFFARDDSVEKLCGYSNECV